MEDLLNRSIVRYDTLSDYGFIKDTQGGYIYKKPIQNGMFEIIVTIKDNKFKIKVMDVLFNEEYRGHLDKTNLTGFKRDIYEEYVSVIQEVKSKCTYPTFFIGQQANRLSLYIQEKYDIHPEHLWGGHPGYSAFKNKDTKKWFACIMNVTYDKLGLNKNGSIEVLNVKIPGNTVQDLLKNLVIILLII